MLVLKHQKLLPANAYLNNEKPMQPASNIRVNLPTFLLIQDTKLSQAPESLSFSTRWRGKTEF